IQQLKSQTMLWRLRPKCYFPFPTLRSRRQNCLAQLQGIILPTFSPMPYRTQDLYIVFLLNQTK
ncbi:MAG TPA: hypothetical protein VJJ82_01770, partial [Candidatus Nanoarchaeia archaeon]|nr:hypothetical protein [Candidatus Nanoarchaeia archaeon]